MESWSRFNRLFRTERYGGFLYGALANVLFKLDDPHWEAARALRDAAAGGAAPEPATARDDDAFLAALREHSILIEPRQEEAQLLARRYARLTAAFDTSELGLTVCPTLACNFRCPYCFEASQGDRTVMSPETVSRLVTFIERHRDARRVALAWYGGEPTLAWGVVRDVTERVKRLDIDFEHAALVTNGYLLDAAKIAALGDLMIDSIQITLDGPRDVHDSRRVHAEGGPTYDRILENVDRLMSSGYEGRCAIRVNVDRDNADRFAGLRRELLERFDGTRLTVYAGHVHVDPGHPYGCGCSFDGDEWAAFTLDLYAREALLPTRGFHPPTHPHGCVANAHQGFVVGPAGELYKCWEDVGLPHMVVGSVHAEDPVTDPVLLATHVETCMMVVSTNNARRETVIRAKKLLETAKVNVVGVVVNGLETGRRHYYYYYYYYDDGAPVRRKWYHFY